MKFLIMMLALVFFVDLASEDDRRSEYLSIIPLIVFILLLFNLI